MLLIVAGRALVAVAGARWLVAGGCARLGLIVRFCAPGRSGAKWSFVRTKPISDFESVDLENSEPNLAVPYWVGLRFGFLARAMAVGLGVAGCGMGVAGLGSAWVGAGICINLMSG
jgi:hypothetical protein